MFDIYTILSSIINLLRTFGAVLIVLGFVIAFAHKLYFIIELISGLAITAVVTYVVWTVTQNPVWTAVAFLLFLAGTILSAAAASLLAIIDGFLVSWVGVVSLLLPSQGLTAEMIFTGAIIAGILTAVAAVLGSLDFGNLRIPLFASLQGLKSGIGSQRRDQLRTPTENQQVCPSCGFQNRLGSYYCRKDGTPLTSRKSTPLLFQSPKPSISCAHCGTVNRVGASFCRICRARLR